MNNTNRPKRYFLDQDNSGHWHLILDSHRRDWERWCDLDEDNEESWNAPAWATRISGGTQTITFPGPVEDCGHRIDKDGET